MFYILWNSCYLFLTKLLNICHEFITKYQLKLLKNCIINKLIVIEYDDQVNYASCSYDRFVKVWDALDNDYQLAEVEHEDAVTANTFSPKVSFAAYKRNVESTPLEKATATLSSERR